MQWHTTIHCLLLLAVFLANSMALLIPGTDHTNAITGNRRFRLLTGGGGVGSGGTGTQRQTVYTGGADGESVGPRAVASESGAIAFDVTAGNTINAQLLYGRRLFGVGLGGTDAPVLQARPQAGVGTGGSGFGQSKGEVENEQSAQQGRKLPEIQNGGGGAARGVQGGGVDTGVTGSFQMVKAPNDLVGAGRRLSAHAAAT